MTPGLASSAQRVAGHGIAGLVKHPENEKPGNEKAQCPIRR